MREDYLKQAQQKISDPHILINVVSKRVKQLKDGKKPTVSSLEKLELEDIALLEVIRGNISYELYKSPKSEE
ncbi:MAG: DNA-directed RNA polymerase subunit omega [Verrucomicrobiaceae bacterium]|nr:DNA-directed RNA polymerase subunit omega [Verrucomicrobiaceae bacterium]